MKATKNAPRYAPELTMEDRHYWIILAHELDIDPSELIAQGTGKYVEPKSKMLQMMKIAVPKIVSLNISKTHSMSLSIGWF